MVEWDSHPSNLQVLKDHENLYYYHDYIEAWMKIILYQNKTFSHSWFLQFDNKFKSKIPLWFLTWWNKHDPIISILPESLQSQVHFYSKNAKFRLGTKNIPILLLFIIKYKVLWILKWKYHMLKDMSTSIASTTGTS